MPTGGDLLVDTSVAVALVVADHRHHEAVSAALVGRRLGLAGHAAFETYSVLTRLPAPARRSPATVRDLLERDFPASCFLPGEVSGELFARLADLGISGGAVYDALVAAAAVHHDLPLVSRDRRAADIYRRLGVALDLLA